MRIASSMISSPDLICRNARRAMFQYPAHRITRATTSRGTKQHVSTSIRIPDLLSPAQTGLDPDQASPRRGRSLLRVTLPGDQLVFRADREPLPMSGPADYSAVEHLRD